MRKKGFTLVELVVAITILGLIMVSVFTIYINLINVNRKLEQTRILQENTRMITEKIATDVREKGIDFNTCGWFEDNPTECLQTNGWNQYYIVRKDKITNKWLASGSGTIGIKSNGDDAVGITSEIVTVKNLHFYPSGSSASGTTNEWLEGKVQVVFDIGLTGGKWVSSAIAENSFITIQTTVSEKIYKGN